MLQLLAVSMEMVISSFIILFALFVIAALYSSVGHGGASGYLAILSLTVYASQDPSWLKQYAWSLNLLVAGLAFWAYSRVGFFNSKLALSFMIASVPAAIFGGLLRVEHGVYDTLLSITLILAAWRLLVIKNNDSDEIFVNRPPVHITVIVGFSIGFLSGIIGVGGGIFLSPIILLFGWADAKTTAGIAAAFIWVNSAAGLIGNSISGQLEIEFGVILPFAVAVILGGLIGSRVGSKVFSQIVVRRMLVSVLLLAAIKRILDLAISAL